MERTVRSRRTDAGLQQNVKTVKLTVRARGDKIPTHKLASPQATSIYHIETGAVVPASGKEQSIFWCGVTIVFQKGTDRIESAHTYTFER